MLGYHQLNLKPNHRVNQPRPAIVAQGSVRRLPRIALLLFCLAYLLPGFIGRMPWRSADISAFGYMRELALGHSDWLAPLLGTRAPEVDALLPYWLGAWALQLAPAWIAPDFAVRLPFIALLALALAGTWYGCYSLARSPLAQPVAFAFGGEANPRDYARAIADGALLALIASLGLAQLSHETTPAQAQLGFNALAFYAAAALPFHRWSAILAGVLGFAGLTLCGAPTVALLLAIGAATMIWLGPQAQDQGTDMPERASIAWLPLLWIALVVVLASSLEVWRWRLHWPAGAEGWQSRVSLLVWFTWPAWPLALWTLLRWRRQLFSSHLHQHLALPLWFSLVHLGTTLFTSAGDRALLLALPTLAVLAAFALPTLRRSLSALIDWFTLLFFTGCAIIIWVVWLAMHTGVPPQPAANVARLLPGFEPRFVILPFVFAVLASLTWAWLVHWRVGRHRAALWKSLVLPAGGAALCWLLLTTLWMPALDFARSYRPLVQRIEASVQPANCIQTFGLSRGLEAGFGFHSRLQLQPASDQASCAWLLIERDIVTDTPEIVNTARWQRHATFAHPREGEEDLVLYRLLPGAASP